MLLAEELRDQKKRRRKKLNVVLLLVGVCVVAATLVIVISQTGLLKPEIEIEDGQAPLALPDFVEDSGILYPIIGNLTLTADETEAEILLQNPEGNTCNLTFEIILTDTGETLYLSESIAPSESLKEQKLTKRLPEGIYKAELIIRAYDPTNQTELGTRTAPIDLVVLHAPDD